MTKAFGILGIISVRRWMTIYCPWSTTERCPKWLGHVAWTSTLFRGGVIWYFFCKMHFLRYELLVIMIIKLLTKTDGIAIGRIGGDIPSWPSVMKCNFKRKQCVARFLTLSLPESVMESVMVILTFESVGDFLWCDHWNKTSSAVLLRGTIYI